MNRIVLTGDIFRTIGGEPMQLSNVEWLARELGPTLKAVAGIDPVIVFRGTDRVRSAAVYYSTLGESPNINAWARTFWWDPPDRLVEALAADYLNALVISIELSPIMEKVLDRLNIPWIDVGISPLRFLQDFAVSFRFSSHFKTSFPAHLTLSDTEIKSSVNRVRDYYEMSPAELEDSIIFFAQTEQDRTLIRDGRFVRSGDVFDWLERRLNKRRLLIKPHPLALDNPIISDLTNRFAGAITDLNTYEILSAAAEVMTISSSVGREAVAFGLSTHTFHDKVQAWAYSGPSSMHHGFSPSLWSFMLSAIMETNDLVAHHWQPNRLRGGLPQFGLAAEIWA